MRFLVTGGAGFIGSNFSRRALDLGHSVLIVDNLSTGRRENIDRRAEFHELDLCDLEKIQPLFFGADYVFHFAALPRVPLSIEKPRETNRNNLESTLCVLVSSHKAGVKRVIYSASSSAYGRQETLPLCETMTPNPLNPYAVQKYVGELYCRIWRELFGLETVSLRYFNVYGPGMPTEGAYTTAIATFLRQRKNGEKLTVFGNGEQTRDFTYVGDVVEANLAAALSPKVGQGEVINIGSGRNYSINKVAELVGGEIAHLAPRPGEARDSRGDVSRAKELLGWEPKMILEEGIRLIKERYL